MDVDPLLAVERDPDTLIEDDKDSITSGGSATEDPEAYCDRGLENCIAIRFRFDRSNACEQSEGVGTLEKEISSFLCAWRGPLFLSSDVTRDPVMMGKTTELCTRSRHQPCRSYKEYPSDTGHPISPEQSCLSEERGVYSV